MEQYSVDEMLELSEKDLWHMNDSDWAHLYNGLAAYTAGLTPRDSNIRHMTEFLKLVNKVSEKKKVIKEFKEKYDKEYRDKAYESILNMEKAFS